ncbi:MAG TPA: hypothetical protein VGS03_08155 [Candidatus Polarisedimenticolia bacterium]|jgi:hypothetical protein|nr:hypothetical protein [Candidatus Polarisedimenticolia bacterium]
MRLSGKEERHVRRGLSLLLAVTLLLLFAGDGLAADPAPAPETGKKPSDWWHDYQFGGFFSLTPTFAEETDGTNVKGLRFSFGPQGQVKHIIGKAETWVSFQQGGDLDVYGVGVQLTAVPFFRKWGGLGFLMNHGLEYRTESPHQGFGGFVGPGVEGILWFGMHVQFTAGVEHDFGIGTRSQDLFHVGIGFGHRVWPPKLPPGIPIPGAPTPES